MHAVAAPCTKSRTGKLKPQFVPLTHETDERLLKSHTVYEQNLYLYHVQRFKRYPGLRNGEVNGICTGYVSTPPHRNSLESLWQQSSVTLSKRVINKLIVPVQAQPDPSSSDSRDTGNPTAPWIPLITSSPLLSCGPLTLQVTAERWSSTEQEPKESVSVADVRSATGHDITVTQG